jgi:malate dehydrogenase (oxaloacetate-decarboxylating)(NADP+)
MLIRPNDALEYHEQPRPGKTEVVPTKPVVTQRDLSLAYTPGVAVPCLRIAEDREAVYRYTNRGNLVAVVTNGTAVLGLGDIGPEAAKPVMEGKGVLFKKFADIDVFDIELASTDPDEVIRTVELLAPTFGGVNLEDIKAPECFYIEEKLRERCDIPVFHDDQHGTAIITAAAFLNALELAEKDIAEVRVVFSGAGAAAISCARLFVHLGVRRENLLLCDSRGVVYVGREKGMNAYKDEFARDTPLRTLADALDGADAFVGVSVADLVTPEMVASMARDPIVFALANPDPEILPEKAQAVRNDVIMATGRSDYPNQVNNVLGFPFIFRGALDVRARAITEEMKVAAVHALAKLARQEVPDEVRRAYGDSALAFGRDYLIPKPFDQRVLLWVAPAVAQAATESGVARRPLDDVDAYRQRLTRLLDPSWSVMQPVYERARRDPKRIVFPEGHHQRVIKAAEICRDEGIAQPVLLGARDVIEGLAEEHGVDLGDIEIIEPWDHEWLDDFATTFHSRRARKGVTRSIAKKEMRHRTHFAVMMVERGHADGVVAGYSKAYADVIRPALQIAGMREGTERAAGAYMVIRGTKLTFFADTTVNIDPDAATLAEIAILTADLAAALEQTPRIAMLSFANFGTTDHPECRKVAAATALVKERRPDLIVDGEMQVDHALDSGLRERLFPFSDLRGEANVLVFPNLAAGNIAYKLMGQLAGAQIIGPILLGPSKPISVLQRDTDTRSIVNMAALTTLRAQGAW